MIRLVQGSQRNDFRREIDEMHRLRARVFHERLKWDVNVVEGREIDEFDEVDPLYLLSVDDNGKVRGSLRLLPTTGPNMLRDVFSVLLPEGQTVESGVIWESSRFSVDHEAAAERTDKKLNRVTGELLSGLFEVALLAGLDYIVSVYDMHVDRILKRAGCRPDPLGEPRRIGRVKAYAGLFDASEEMVANIRSASGITGSVLEEESVRRLMLAA